MRPSTSRARSRRPLPRASSKLAPQADAKAHSRVDKCDDGTRLVAAPGNFDVATQHDGAALVVAPRGEIDLATVDLVREAVERDLRSGEDLVLDLREVGFMDTSGLRYVLELVDRSSRGGFALRLVRGPTAVQRVFEVSGVEPRLPFVDDPKSGAGSDR
jgi:anti-anti-sigma factor